MALQCASHVCKRAQSASYDPPPHCLVRPPNMHWQLNLHNPVNLSKQSVFFENQMLQLDYLSRPYECLQFLGQWPCHLQADGTGRCTAHAFEHVTTPGMWRHVVIIDAVRYLSPQPGSSSNWRPAKRLHYRTIIIPQQISTHSAWNRCSHTPTVRALSRPMFTGKLPAGGLRKFILAWAVVSKLGWVRRCSSLHLLLVSIRSVST